MADAAAAWLRKKLPTLPRIAVVLGSGLGDLDLGKPSLEIPYASIPGFPKVRVKGHPGRLSIVGPAAILRGRVHGYEGHPLEVVVGPVRTMAALGVRRLVLTNAAGGIRRSLRTGALMVISDHLNLMGQNPLRGGPNFVDLTGVYETGLRALRGLPKGVYAGVPGPSYETPAEVRMLRTLGADAVGMSTVPEAIAARAAGLEVLGISLITNAAAGTTSTAVSHEEVLEAADRARPRMASLLRRIVAEWGRRGRP